MNTGTTLTFHLPEGWTVRKVATAMVREWLPQFRAEPAVKAARWVVQSVMENPDGGEAPLWEPGISTAEYEERLDRANLAWAIRATAGRSKGTILARLVKSDENAFQLVSCQTSFPDALFDAAKMDEFLQGQEAAGDGGLFAALLASHGFELTQGS